MSQVQRQPNPYKPLIMENNYSEFACLIGHQALRKGELLEPKPGCEYTEKDDRGLPIWIVFKNSNRRWLNGVHYRGMPML